MQTVVIDFAAARARIERLAEHSIELCGVDLADAPDRTVRALLDHEGNVVAICDDVGRPPILLERLRETLDEQQIAELLHVTLEECR